DISAGEVQAVVETHEDLDAATLRQLADAEKNKGTPFFVAISSAGAEKTLFVVVSTLPTLPANAFASAFGAQIGGKGGGRGDFAQGGGTGLKALADYAEIVRQVLTKAAAH